MATDWVTASPVRDTQAGETAGANSRRTDHDPAQEGSILSERARLPSSVTDLDGHWRKLGTHGAQALTQGTHQSGYMT